MENEAASGAPATGQSPIDIRCAAAAGPSTLRFHYRAEAPILRNDGRFVKAKFTAAGGLTLDGAEYRLAEVHTHQPSEHTIEGRRFDMEAHLVHLGQGGEIAVVGLLYRLGRDNGPLGRLIDEWPPPAQERTAGGPVDASALLPAGRTHYRYCGSLTTPPYTEGVRWVVMAEAQPLSEAQMARVRAHTGGRDTARCVQPLAGRRVEVAG